MKRSDFLKILGFSVAAPSVLVPVVGDKFRKEQTWKSQQKRWPIYPEFNYTVIGSDGGLMATLFSYVKINMNGADYLIPVKETYHARKGDSVKCKTLKERFDHYVKMAQDHYQVDEKHEYINGIQLFVKYNPLIHHN